MSGGAGEACRVQHCTAADHQQRALLVEAGRGHPLV
jgi:hypothetical protein